MAEIEDLLVPMLRDIRKEQTDHRTLLLSLVDAVRRMEQRLDTRLGEVESSIRASRDDLELMLKAELLGRLTHFETMLEQRIDLLAERIAAIERA